MTLHDFLLKRLAEDEASARAALDTWESDDHGGWFAGLSKETVAHIARHDPAHVLADCEARRNLIEEVLEFTAAVADAFWKSFEVKDRILAQMALRYVPHADFREEWRP